MNTMKYLLIILISLISISCNKIFSESAESFIFQIKDDVYLDKPTQSILYLYKTNEDSYTLGRVIVDHIDSIYISKNKDEVYIINDKNECIWVKADFKIKKLNKKPNVKFTSIYSF